MIDTVKLGEIGTFVSGGTPSRKHPEYYDGTIPWVSTPALNGGLLDESNAVQLITEDAISNSATKLLPPRSLLIGIRVGVGKTAINAVPMCFNQDIVAITGVDEARWDIRYVSYAVQAKSAYLVSQKQGATITGITSKLLKSLEIKQLNIEAQRSRVSNLDCIKKQIGYCESQREKLDELVKSRFVEMFGDPDSNACGYEKTTLGSVLSVQPTNGLYKPQKEYVANGGGVPIVRIDSFRTEGPDYPRLKRLNCSDVELDRYGLSELDIVINRVNSVGCMGKTMLVSNLPGPVVFESNMMRIHSDESRVLPAFLCAQMTSDYAKAYFEGNAKRAIGQASINQTDVKNLPVLVPPLQVQNEYLAFVQRVDKLKFVAQQQIDKLQMLYDSLAQEYFSAE